MNYRTSMKPLFSVMVLWVIAGGTLFAAADSVVVRTSFEGSDLPAYSVGSVAGQNNWSIAGGEGKIVADPAAAHAGANGLKMVTASALGVLYTPFSGTVQGPGGILYFDCYIKIAASSGKEFTMNVNDLFGGSQKRAAVVDFSVPVSGTGSIRIYNGGSKVVIAPYAIGTWYRISGKLNFNDSIYQVCVNAGTAVTAQFREPYYAKGSGSRPAGTKEFHQILFNLGADDNTGTVDAAVDELYVGSAIPQGVTFGAVVVKYKVSVMQPDVGTITLAPSGSSFDAGTTVRATLSLPGGYKNLGWTGDVSGTDTMVTFQVATNMSIGATVGVDSTHPPKTYRVTVTQPSYGAITLSSNGVAANSFYMYSKVTATLVLPPGYRNNGWRGALSGTELVKSFTLLSDTTLTAEVLPPLAGSRKTFSTASAFKAAMALAAAGDTLELTNGTYDVGTISPDSGSISGTAENPILIRAANRGAVELNGSSAFDLRFSAYITIEGFVFTGSASTAVRTECSHHIRITRNVFRMTEAASNKWILIGGYYRQPLPLSHHNRIDHNRFENKTQPGNFITIDGSPQTINSIDNPFCASSQNDRIDHNYFKKSGPRIDNGMESIRVGWSKLSLTSGYTVVEENLFEDCDGDPEIISVKSCDDTIRFNTFRRSLGTLSLRHGNRSTACGNFFFGEGKTTQYTDPATGSTSTIGTGGIRFYGDDHRIYNNYFENLTGDRWDAAITITNGDQDYPSTSLDGHFRPRRAVVAFNTMVNNAHNIQIGYTGSGYAKPPQDITIANNLITGSQFELVKILTAPISTVFSGNIMFPVSGATLGMTAGAAEARVVDPLLERRDSLWRLSGASPAIDAAVGIYEFIDIDMDGQLRPGLKDVGADELSVTPKIHRPLLAQDVGPDAPEMTVTTVSGRDLPPVPLPAVLFPNYPNPFNPSTMIHFVTPFSGVARLGVFSLLGQEVAVIFNGRVESGHLYRAVFDARGLASGLYFARLEFGGRLNAQKMILAK
ncbi:MAG: T9SS type A sorting domain-containing protein [Ignavibacteriales bacterium]|nr:T9SS type A sorting domain-containing protein [Ignavibacteriales bacterium]